jgi:hypothetical protein
VFAWTRYQLPPLDTSHIRLLDPIPSSTREIELVVQEENGENGIGDFVKESEYSIENIAKLPTK